MSAVRAYLAVGVLLLALPFVAAFWLLGIIVTAPLALCRWLSR